MTARQIEKAQRGKPFKPYRVFLSDQRSFLVKHPEFLWIVPGGRHIGIADEDGAADFIDLIHVTGIRISEEVEQTVK